MRTAKTGMWAVALIMISFMAVRSVAQEPVSLTAGDTASGPEKLTLNGSDTPVAGGGITHTSPDSQLISITLDEQPLDVVVSMFNRMPGVNLIANPTNLQGKVTVNLTEVEWKPALVSMLEMHNLQLLEKTPGSGVYSILPRSPDTPDPMEVTTVFLRYAKVTDVIPVVKPMLVPNGTISAFPARNAVIMRSTAPNLREIERVVDKIDTIRDQVFIEAKFMELNDGAIKDLGINWQVLEGYGVGVGNLAWSLTDTKTLTDSDVSTADASDVDTLFESDDRGYDLDGSAMDRPVITHYTEIPGSDPPMYDSWSEKEATTERLSTRNRSVSDSRTVTKSDIRTKETIQTAVLGADDFRLVLSALQQQSGVTIVSNPKIVVANEEPAVIHIGETERPFISSVTAGQNGIAPVVTYNPGDEVDFGVKLIVTPTVNTASNITVQIAPELTRFVRDAIAPNGQTYPVIARKKISTVFCIESGRTVAIGGLTETHDRERVTKIPLLGDIPLIGKYLFSHTHKEKAQKETVIFVTVGLAHPGSIQTETGLPEDTELARRQLIRAKYNRQKRDANLLETQRAFEAEIERELDKVKDEPPAEPVGDAPAVTSAPAEDTATVKTAADEETAEIGARFVEAVD